MILRDNLLPHLWLNIANNPVASNADQRNIIPVRDAALLDVPPNDLAKKTCHNGLTRSGWVEGNLGLMNSDIYNFFHILLVLLPSTHTFQVHARLKKHFSTCTSFVYKQFNFLVYITMHLVTSVSAVINISCVSDHKHLMCQRS
jgi:hypothetical protein